MSDYQNRMVYGDEGLGGISANVTSLPVGYQLGERRHVSGVDYVLAYNKGNSAADQGCLLAATVGCGVLPYSVTVTTVTESVNPAIVGWVQNATVPTASYFWMATYGFPAGLRASNISIATGVFVGPAAAGLVITTNTTANYVAVNIGDTTTATAQTNGSGGAYGRFFVFGCNQGLAGRGAF